LIFIVSPPIAQKILKGCFREYCHGNLDMTGQKTCFCQMWQGLGMSGDWCTDSPDAPRRYGNSGKGEAPFWSEASNGYFHESHGSVNNSQEQGDARMRKDLSFRHGICNKGRLLNRP